MGAVAPSSAATGAARAARTILGGLSCRRDSDACSKAFFHEDASIGNFLGLSSMVPSIQGSSLFPKRSFRAGDEVDRPYYVPLLVHAQHIEANYQPRHALESC